MHYLLQGHVVFNEQNEPLTVNEKLEACDDKDALWKAQRRASELYTEHNKKHSRTKATKVYLQAIKHLEPVIANGETDAFYKLQARLLEKRGMPRERAIEKAG